MASNLGKLYPIGRLGVSGFRHNVDGFLTWNAAPSEPVTAYLQLFRSGAVESVLILPTQELVQGARAVSALDIELALLECADMLLKNCVEWRIGMPVVIALSLLTVGDTFFQTAHGRSPFDRGEIHLPDLLVDDPESADLPVLLRPLLDSLWQAAGYPQYYLDHGEALWLNQSFRADPRRWEDLRNPGEETA